MAMTEKEKVAVEEKINNPNKTIFCPRCNRPLMYETPFSSIWVHCEKCKEIQGSVRGI